MKVFYGLQITNHMTGIRTMILSDDYMWTDILYKYFNAWLQLDSEHKETNNFFEVVDKWANDGKILYFTENNFSYDINVLYGDDEIVTLNTIGKSYLVYRGYIQVEQRY